MKKRSIQPAKSRKQPAEITKDHLESKGRPVAELPDAEGFDQSLYQLGQDFYLVKANMFLD